MKRKSNPEARAELERLKQRAPALRQAGMTSPAILAAWFLFGDDMWETESIAQNEPLCQNKPEQSTEL